MHRVMFKRVPATNRIEATMLARRLCQCIRMTFSGVSWIEAGTEHTLRWEDIQ